MKRHPASLLLLCVVLLLALAFPQRAVAVVNTSSQTVILSNEGTNGLISQLLAAGYGNLDMYDALKLIVGNSNPTVAGIITPAFFNALAACPASSQIFTMQLTTFDPGKGTGLAISTDGTVQYTNVTGVTFYDDGAPTLASDISGVGRGLFTHSNSSAPLTSWNSSGGGVTTTYNVFAIGWESGTAPPATPAPPSLWLAIIGCAALLGYALWSRRRAVLLLLIALFALSPSARATAPAYQTFVLSNEGGGLISQMLTAGYGNLNLYAAVLKMSANCDPTVSGVLTPNFFQALASNPGSSPVFTTELKNVNAAGQGIAISTDGTVQVVNISGAAWQGQAGVSSLVSDISGVGDATFLSGNPITAFTSGGKTYNVFAIAYAPSSSPPPATPAPPSLWLAVIGCAALLGYALWLRRGRHA